MNNLVLKNSPTLHDLQQYVAEMMQERGFQDTLSQRFMLLMEESGEFAKAARKMAGMKFAEDTSRKDSVALEAADVLIILLGLCNILGIDLEAAFREKEELNKKRKWHKL